jgi:hypothetical protein
MVSKADFKNLFQSPLKETLSKKEEQESDESNMELDVEMNVFDKLMEGKQTETLIKNDDGPMSIANTTIFFSFRPD